MFDNNNYYIIHFLLKFLIALTRLARTQWCVCVSVCVHVSNGGKKKLGESNFSQQSSHSWMFLKYFKVF